MPSQTDLERETIRSAAAELLQRDVVGLERIGGGRNSQVFRVEDTHSQRFALKAYYRHGSDTRDRLGTEFSAISFLWGRGLRQVPRPIAVDAKRGCAIYEFIEGGRVADEKVNRADLDAAIALIRSLTKLRGHSTSLNFRPASEACFSVQAIVEHLGQRRERLTGAQGVASALTALKSFLADKFAPAFENFVRWSRSHLRRAGIDYEQELSMAERTLSPSDFGFHNALRQADGRIVFLDFEYFGWDDPAKLIADFLLHPAMDLPADLKRYFATNAVQCFPENHGLARRVEAVFPLFGLKWCLIFLNEFLPDDLRRRQFAHRAELDQGELQMKQLQKAQRMLSGLQSKYEHFPYFD